jgi:hypothetical protein
MAHEDEHQEDETSGLLSEIDLCGWVVGSRHLPPW